MGDDWEHAAMYAALKAQYADKKQDEDDDEEAPAKFDVIEPGVEVVLPKMAKSMKGVFEMAEYLGWSPRIRTSLIHVHPVLFKADSKEDAKNQHIKGDVRYKAKDQQWYCMGAAHPGQKLGFQAFWCGTSFVDAVVYDPVGIPVELFGNYKPSQWQIDYLGEQRANDRALKRHMTYNDRTSHLWHVRGIDSKTDFDTWLGDWATMLVPSTYREEQAA